MIKWSPLLLAAACLAPSLLAQTPVPTRPDEPASTIPFVPAHADAVVTSLAKELEENFVFPEVGRAYANMLRAKLAAGGYAAFPSGQAFADALTADLQAVHRDRHVRVRANGGEGGGSGPRRMMPGAGPGGNGVSRSGWLADGVAYIRFEAFPGNEATLEAIRTFLSRHANARTLIIDARSHRGGGLAEMDILFPQLFDKPTRLVSMDTRVAVEQRRGSPVADVTSLRLVDAPPSVVRREHWVTPADRPALAKAKLYLLTSSRTGSAGEHLSLALKRTGRATLVGETTAGAGHYGGVVPLGHDYAAFIPVGRTFDPDTGLGWEAVGVKPDVATSAEAALDTALRMAGLQLSAEAALAALD